MCCDSEVFSACHRFIVPEFVERDLPTSSSLGIFLVVLHIRHMHYLFLNIIEIILCYFDDAGDRVVSEPPKQVINAVCSR
jgi:hypothetical protein